MGLDLGRGLVFLRFLPRLICCRLLHLGRIAVAILSFHIRLASSFYDDLVLIVRIFEIDGDFVESSSLKISLWSGELHQLGLSHLRCCSLHVTVLCGKEDLVIR